MTLRSVLCRVLGGHELGLPKVIEGRYRLVCRLGCGYQTVGIETLGMEQARIVASQPINLIVYRSGRSVWSKAA